MNAHSLDRDQHSGHRTSDRRSGYVRVMNPVSNGVAAHGCTYSADIHISTRVRARDLRRIRCKDLTYYLGDFPAHSVTWHRSARPPYLQRSINQDGFAQEKRNVKIRPRQKQKRHPREPRVRATVQRQACTPSRYKHPLNSIRNKTKAHDKDPPPRAQKQYDYEPAGVSLRTFGFSTNPPPLQVNKIV